MFFLSVYAARRTSFENNTVLGSSSTAAAASRHRRALLADAPSATPNSNSGSAASASTSGPPASPLALTGSAGGAVLLNGSSVTAALSACGLSGGRAPLGAAIALAGGAACAATDGTTFENNTASIAGGVAFVFSSAVGRGSVAGTPPPPAALLPAFMTAAGFASCPASSPRGGGACAKGNSAALWGPLGATDTLSVEFVALMTDIYAGESLNASVTVRDGFGAEVSALPGSRIGFSYPGLPASLAGCASPLPASVDSSCFCEPTHRIA